MYIQNPIPDITNDSFRTHSNGQSILEYNEGFGKFCSVCKEQLFRHYADVNGNKVNDDWRCGKTGTWCGGKDVRHKPTNKCDIEKELDEILITFPVRKG